MITERQIRKLWDNTEEGAEFDSYELFRAAKIEEHGGLRRESFAHPNDPNADEPLIIE